MWFWLTLLSAILGAIEIVFNKKMLHKVDAVIFTWAIFTFSLPIIGYIALKDGIPSLNQLFFLGTISSSFLFVISATVRYDTIKKTLVSKIMPLTAFGALFTYIFGLIFLSETLAPLPLGGLVFIVIGAYVLNADLAREDYLKPFKILFTDRTTLIFLIATLMGNLSGIFDKIGILNTTPLNPSFALLTENTIMSLILTLYIVLRKKTSLLTQQIHSHFFMLFINSLMYTGISLLVFYAFADGPVALVQGVKRLQIFFMLLLGIYFLNERPTKHIWIGSAVMTAGVLLIKLTE